MSILQMMPLIWLVIAVLLGVLEAITVDMIAIWFSLGSLVAIIPAALSAPFWLQLVIFLAVSLLSLAVTRPLVVDVLKVKKTSTNADQIIGMLGVVIEEIDNVKDIGRIKVHGLDWSARSDDGAPIEVDTQVLVKEIQGVKTIVERV